MIEIKKNLQQLIEIKVSFFSILGVLIIDI